MAYFGILLRSSWISFDIMFGDAMKMIWSTVVEGSGVLDNHDEIEDSFIPVRKRFELEEGRKTKKEPRTTPVRTRRSGEKR